MADGCSRKAAPRPGCGFSATRRRHRADSRSTSTRRQDFRGTGPTGPAHRALPPDRCWEKDRRSNSTAATVSPVKGGTWRRRRPPRPGRRRRTLTSGRRWPQPFPRRGRPLPAGEPAGGAGAAVAGDGHGRPRITACGQAERAYLGTSPRAGRTTAVARLPREPAPRIRSDRVSIRAPLHRSRFPTDRSLLCQQRALDPTGARPRTSNPLPAWRNSTTTSSRCWRAESGAWARWPWPRPTWTGWPT